jgi:hypothetical protein
MMHQMRPDRFFDAGQIQRLAELMNRWRIARDSGKSLPPDEQSELEALVETEVRAAGERAAAIANSLQLPEP